MKEKQTDIKSQASGQNFNVDNATSSKSQDPIKASKIKKEILKSNKDKISREIVPKQDKSKDRTEVLTNEEAFEFGNIEINIDDDVLEIYA